MENYEPMMAKKGSVDLLEKTNLIGYIFEPKLDGTRVFIHKDRDNIAIFNQRKKDIIASFPELLDLAAYIKTRSCVLDAELVILNNRGSPDQELLQEREQEGNVQEIKIKSKKFPATIFIFDILEKDTMNLTKEPLRKRKLILKDIIKQGTNISLMSYTMHGKDLWQQIQEQKIDGMIAKEASSKYVAGKSWSWLKIMKNNAINAIVIGMEKKKEFLAIILAVYDENTGSFKYAGKIQDIDKKQLKLLKKLAQPVLTNNPSIELPKEEQAEKKEKEKSEIKWLLPSLIARVNFKELQDNKLVQPKLARIRFDKYPKDCVLD
jgi:bifunctional non-homologous end joining protein LigD